METNVRRREAGEPLEVILGWVSFAGIRVPIDVSLVGFDDMAGAGFLVPALTTVRQDFVTLGALSIRMLTGMLQGDDPATRRIPPDLIVRSSTLAPSR